MGGGRNDVSTEADVGPCASMLAYSLACLIHDHVKQLSVDLCQVMSMMVWVHAGHEHCEEGVDKLGFLNIIVRACTVISFR